MIRDYADSLLTIMILQGMMTNCWFKVKLNVCRPSKGEIGLAFQHPVQPGNQSGGWMARQKHLEIAKAAAAATPTGIRRSTSAATITNANTDDANNKKTFSMSEVREHASKDSAWIVVHDQVYDCTAYLEDHPGGADSILINAGTDCTEEFDAIHSDKATALLDAYRIGDLVTDDASSVHSASGLPHLDPIRETSADDVTASLSTALPVVALADPQEKVPCRLV
jgi:nitrate reductase (NAD(P)H)